MSPLQVSTETYWRLRSSILCSTTVQRWRERYLYRFHPLDILLRGARTFTNREDHSGFDFTLFSHNRREGVSAIVRTRNEARKITYCLRSILNVFDEIVFVDNGSDDATMSMVRELKDAEDKHDIIKIYSYPFQLARLGPEHSNTPEDSVHSAVYYSNWAFSLCSFKYVCKWDGDMILRSEVRASFQRFLRRIQPGRTMCWRLAGQTIYRDLAGDYFLSIGEINEEVEVFPYGLNQRFYKNRHWECPMNRSRLPVGNFGPVAFYELKFAEEDEFSHWSTTEWPSERKTREWENFQLIRQGQIRDLLLQKLPRRFLEHEVATPSDAGRVKPE